MTHSVGKETLAVTCGSVACAMELRPRLGDWNRSLLMPVIERVLNEADIAGRHIQIPRLEVHLGDIALSEFEDVAAERLYRALKEAVDRAIRSPFNSSARTEIHSRIEILEWYLLRGTLPPQASSSGSFSLDAWFAELAERDPAALAKLVRSVATSDHALERIVFQLSPKELRRLLAVLEPEHAALILAYMLDLTEIQREEPIATVREAEFDRLLWYLVFAYLTREAGSQFNRKIFVQSLILGFAERQGMEYEDVLAILGNALERTLVRRGLPSSLPAVIAELIGDADTRGDLPPRPVSGDADAEELSPAKNDLVALARLVRLRGTDPAWLSELVRALDETELVALLGVLEPQQAKAIVAFLFDIRDVHRAEPAASGESARFERLLWLLTLTWAVEESGTEFNRKAFLLSLLRGLARKEGLDFAAVVGTFRMGLAKVAIKAPLRSPLPAVLAAVIEDLGYAELQEEALRFTQRGVKPGPAADAEARARSLMEMAFGSRSPAQQLSLIQAAASQMSVPALRGLISRILPSVDKPGSLIAEALEEALRSAGDARMFYAHLIAAALRGEDLDLERIGAESRGASPLPYAPGSPPDRGLAKAAIAAGIAAGVSSSEEGQAISLLVLNLLREEAHDARSFLAPLAGPWGLSDAIARSAAPADFETILVHAAGPNAQALQALLRGVAALSGSDKPDERRLRSVLLTETLRQGTAREPDESFFERVLAASFPLPLPARVREALLAAIPESATTGLRSVLEAGDSLVPPTPAFELADNESDAADEALVRQLDAALEERSGAAPAAVGRLLADRRTRTRLSKILPQSTWDRLLRFLEPGRYRAVLEAEPILTSAWVRALPGSRAAEIRSTLRAALLEAVSEGSFSVEALVAKALQLLVRAAPADSQAAARFRIHAERLAEEKGVAGLRQVLAPPPVRRKPPVKSTPLPEETGAPIYVTNAGLVLASPFLPHLFSTLGMLEPDEKGRSRWRDRQTSTRAVHLLQYLVDERTSTPEPLLVLNKILCGLPTAAPVERSIDLSAEEEDICGKLLDAMIANWTILANSTPAALRETFFQREGRLDRADGIWKLRVQRKTLDVLVDQIPWSFGAIFHDWMPETVRVTW